jgi:hypothetical protein
MPDRKWPFEPSTRPDGAPLPADSGGFSIETTTMRLKSLKLRREEVVTQPVEPKPAEAASRGGVVAGRVRHDDRGMAVWDWAVATGEFATLSATNAMKKLEIGDLQIEETQRARAIQPQGRDVGGGGDPYNQRGSGQRPGEAGKRQGITGSPDRRTQSVLDQLTGKK